MNAKQIIAEYGNNQKAVLNQLHNDLRDLIRQRKAYEAKEIATVFREINDRYLAVIRKAKFNWNENALIEAYPSSLQHILRYSKYCQDSSRAIQNHQQIPSIYDYVPFEINLTFQVGEFLKLILNEELNIILEEISKVFTLDLPN